MRWRMYNKELKAKGVITLEQYYKITGKESTSYETESFGG